MASPTTTTTASIDGSASAASPWLFGPGRDLILGCGVGYAAILAVVLLLGDSARSWLPMSALTFALLFTSTPHYGATLLRVYDQRESRRRYAVFAVWTTLGLLLAFVVSCYWYDLGSGFVTLYLNWSPWHYAGQNFGIALMFLHRRGVPVTATAKRWLYASFLLSFFIVFVKNNGATPEPLYDGVQAASTAGTFAPIYRVMSLGIPGVVQSPLLIAGLLAYAIATVGAFVQFGRGGRWRKLGPTALIVFTQSLWFTLPALLRTFDVLGDHVAFSLDDRTYSFRLIAIGHAVQYLWITAYYARREPGARSTPRHLLHCLLASCIVWYVPALLLAPPALGAPAYGDGLAFLIAALVNVHHFILDGAIWKLRDGRVARVLLRSRGDDVVAPSRTRRAPLIRAGVWSAGAVCLFVGACGDYERDIAAPRAVEEGNLERFATAVHRLADLGQDEARMHRRLAIAAAARNEDDLALREFEASLRIREHPRAWFEIGHIHAKREHWRRAVEAYEAAYALDPLPPKLIGRLAWAHGRAGNLERAEAVLRAGLVVHEDAPGLSDQLEKLLQETGR